MTLVLSRREGQRLILSNGVAITVKEARNGKASIGIDAPPEVVIDREEVYQRKLKEQAATNPT